MKSNYFPKQEVLVGRAALLYIFANLFNVWLDRKQLDFRNCFCTQSVVMFQAIQNLRNSQSVSWKYPGEGGDPGVSL